jgi:hypothetical protein
MSELDYFEVDLNNKEISYFGESQNNSLNNSYDQEVKYKVELIYFN